LDTITTAVVITVKSC